MTHDQTPHRRKSNSPTPMSPHFFKRDADGRARPRITFSAEMASLIEEAAGDTPLILYIQRVLKNRAEYHIRKRAQLQAAGQLPDPDEGDDEQEAAQA